MAGLGPAPFAGMLLADLGAEVVLIERPDRQDVITAEADLSRRAKKSICLNLKNEQGLAVAKSLISRADAVIEGYRPGVMERLGLGPEACWAENPKLVFGRLTGFGQDGPMATVAGHDINFLSLTGALHALGPAGRPMPPLNMAADMGGGGMMLAFGMMAALWEAQRSGKGQVVDATMLDGVALLMVSLANLYNSGLWDDSRREANLLDSGAHFYGTYECADGGFIAVGAIEPQFYQALLEGLGLEPAAFQPQDDKSRWLAWRAEIAAAFKTRTRDEWVAHFDGIDACLSPVLSIAEARAHPHLALRGTWKQGGNGHIAPAPAPRFSRSRAADPAAPPPLGADTDSLLAALGYDGAAITALRQAGAVT